MTTTSPAWTAVPQISKATVVANSRMFIVFSDRQSSKREIGGGHEQVPLVRSGAGCDLAGGDRQRIAAVEVVLELQPDVGAELVAHPEHERLLLERSILPLCLVGGDVVV